MYCKYCGSKIKEGADICLKCGKIINETKDKFVSKQKSAGRGFSIAGMVLGIVALLLVLGEFSDFSEISSELSFAFYGEFLFSVFEYIIGDFVFPVLGLIFSIIGIYKQRNGFNISGIILNSISFIMMIALFVCILLLY